MLVLSEEVVFNRLLLKHQQEVEDGGVVNARC